MTTNYQIETAKFLISRLERLSADSYWAHRASGLRGALLRQISLVETSTSLEVDDTPSTHLDSLLQSGFQLLEKAAREIPEYK